MRICYCFAALSLLRRMAVTDDSAIRALVYDDQTAWTAHTHKRVHRNVPCGGVRGSFLGQDRVNRPIASEPTLVQTGSRAHTFTLEPISPQQRHPVVCINGGNLTLQVY